jgi:hypothetical protein
VSITEKLQSDPEGSKEVTMSMKQDLHDRLWQAFQRWHALRQTGLGKRDLKVQGIRESGDPNGLTRPLIFTGNTMRSYERVLREFVDFAQREHGATRLEEIGKKEFRAYMDRAIAQGLAVRTLNLYRSALAKFGSAVTRQTESFASLSEKYGWKIRQLAKLGQLPGPTRRTPGREVLDRAIAILRDWDARHFARTGEPRAYHLAARLQIETACRSISVTTRLTGECLREGNRLVATAKGGKHLSFTLSPNLHRTLRLWFAYNPGPLASQGGYRSAYARAVEAAGGRVPGTHGARRRSVQDWYSSRYRQAVGSGVAPADAAQDAAEEALERLGHSRHRRDHRAAYLGP